jgi:hypothetical protein
MNGVAARPGWDKPGQNKGMQAFGCFAVTLINHLVNLDIIDPKRIGLMGYIRHIWDGKIQHPESL